MSGGGLLASASSNSSMFCGPSSFDNLVSNCNLNNSNSNFCQSNQVVGEPPSCIFIPALPQFREMADPIFVWGSLDGPTCITHICACYDEAVHWKPNLFHLPTGRVGEKFVKELTCLFNDNASASALESIAIKAAYLLPLLVLQRSFEKLKSKVIAAHIDRRLNLWLEGHFLDLLGKGRDIQHRLSTNYHITKDFQLPRSFANLMMEGKVYSVIHLLSNGSKGTVLTLNSLADHDDPSRGTVRDMLAKKHPIPGPIFPEAILLNNTPPCDHDPHFSIFDRLDDDLIKRLALRSSGAAGPSGIDASGWRRLCSSFSSSSTLCNALAHVAYRLCTSYVHPSGITALFASRLIALDKYPGVRPIGIGEISRRIISKAVLVILGNDVIDATGPLQLCAGQDLGCGTAVHCIRQLYEDTDTEALLLVDATNAFNSLNREVALKCSPPVSFLGKSVI